MIPHRPVKKKYFPSAVTRGFKPYSFFGYWLKLTASALFEQIEIPLWRIGFFFQSLSAFDRHGPAMKPGEALRPDAMIRRPFYSQRIETAGLAVAARYDWRLITAAAMKKAARAGPKNISIVKFVR